MTWNLLPVSPLRVTIRNIILHFYDPGLAGELGVLLQTFLPSINVKYPKKTKWEMKRALTAAAGNGCRETRETFRSGWCDSEWTFLIIDVNLCYRNTLVSWLLFPTFLTSPQVWSLHSSEYGINCKSASSNHCTATTQGENTGVVLLHLENHSCQ